MRRLLAISGLSLLALTACSEQSPSPEPLTGLPRASELAPTVACPSADSIRALIRGMYPLGTRRTQVNSTYTTIRNRLAAGNIPGAQELSLLLTKSVLEDFYAGRLSGGQSSGTADLVSAFVNGLFCQVGLPVPNLTLNADAAAAVVTPSSPTTTLVTPTQFAGIQVPGGSAPQPTLITVRRLPDQPGPLLTSLDQYPAFYEYEATPAVSFSLDLIVGVCQADDFLPGDYGRLKIAHNVGTGIEVLNRVPAPFIDCTSLIGAGPFLPGLKGYATRSWRWMMNAVLPAPAYAALGTCCLGGTTKSFSPFGAVDTLAILNLVPPLTLSGAPGSAVPLNDLPTIRLLTPTGRGVAGAAITFSLSGNSDASITGTSKVTNANGLVELSSWTLGTDNVPDTVFVTVTPTPGTGVQGNGGFFVAIP